VLGALNLFGTTVGPLSGDDLDLAQAQRARRSRWICTT